MRESLEIYRWMWREIDLKYEGSLGFRLVLFFDAVASDAARSAQLTVARAIRIGGLRVGRAFRSPVLPAAARGAVGAALAVALFGPFIALLGTLASPDRSSAELTVHAAGFVVFKGQKLSPAHLPGIVDRFGFSTVEVLLRDAPDNPIRWSTVEEVARNLESAGVDRVVYRDFKTATRPAGARSYTIRR